MSDVNSGPQLAPEALGAWESDVVLADGEVIHLRPLLPDDLSALRDFVDGLSDESRYFRFFSYRRPGNAELAKLVELDAERRMALAATDHSGLIGVGRYIWDDDQKAAEIAFAVADAHQSRASEPCSSSTSPSSPAHEAFTGSTRRRWARTRR